MKRGTASANFLDSCAKKKEVEEARALLDEMQKNVEEAQARASATEQKEFSRFDDYMCLQVSHAPHVRVDLDSSYFRELTCC